MNEEPTSAPGQGMNLAVLKGIVWGLGILLILGTILMVVFAVSRMDKATPQLDADQVELVLETGEEILYSDAAPYGIVITLGRGDTVTRLIVVDPATGRQTEIQPMNAAVGLSNP